MIEKEGRKKKGTKEGRKEGRIEGLEMTNFDIVPGGGSEVAVGTLKSAGIHVRPLVVLHV